MMIIFEIPFFYINQYFDYNNLFGVFYAATHRSIWSVCWAFILFFCLTGQGGIINSILSWNKLIPLSKLSFLVYLFHMPILQFIAAKQVTLWHINQFKIVRTFILIFLSYQFLNTLLKHLNTLLDSFKNTFFNLSIFYFL
jgi:peptidoglycan/LPS O-acetylase OafA/YrhL